MWLEKRIDNESLYECNAVLYQAILSFGRIIYSKLIFLLGLSISWFIFLSKSIALILLRMWRPIQYEMSCAIKVLREDLILFVAFSAFGLWGFIDGAVTYSVGMSRIVLGKRKKLQL